MSPPVPRSWEEPAKQRGQQWWIPACLSPPSADGVPRLRGGCMAAISFLALYIVTRIIMPCAFPWAWARLHSCRGDAVHPWERRTPNTPPPRPPRYNLAIATVVDNFMSKSIRDRTIENKRQYADFWGYPLIAPSVDEVRALAEGFPTAWAKLKVAENALKTHDYVLMVDGDAVIMRENIDLALAIDEMERAGASLLISKDFNSLNSGIFLLKNSSWTSDFLAEATTARPMLAQKTRTIPLKYENRAFFYLTGMWPACEGIRRLDSIFAPNYGSAAKFRDGVLLVDRCMINRRPSRAPYVWQILDSGAGFDDLTNAFITHVPGGKPDTKQEAMEVLLRSTNMRHDQALLAASL